MTVDHINVEESIQQVKDLIAKEKTFLRHSRPALRFCCFWFRFW